MVGFLSLAVAAPGFGQTNPAKRLRYAQVANGIIGSNTYVATLLVSNPNNFPVQASIDSFDDANPANSMGLGFTTNCAINPSTNEFTIPVSSTCQFISNGQGAQKIGWLRVTESTNTNPLGGYLSFTFYQGNQFAGFPIFTVGVSPTPVFSQFSIPVVRDAASNLDVGFAMDNPFPDGPTTMVAQLVNSAGSVVASQNITLGALAHMAKFLSEVFPSVLGSASNFVGNLVVTAQTSTDGAIATSLLQQKGQFGGAPPTSNAISIAKRANDFDLREIQGSTRPHEELTNSPASGRF